MAIPSELSSILGPVSGAIVAGSVAFLASLISKENKTSEFRQAWIDLLREDIADLIALVLLTDDVIAHKIRQGKTNEVPQYILDHHDEFVKIVTCAARIELRLNPKEHQKLLDLVRAVGTASKTFRGNTDATVAQADSLLIESQIVLKCEWRRVKRGEKVFFATKWLSLLVAVVAIAIGVFAAQGHVVLQYVP